MANPERQQGGEKNKDSLLKSLGKVALVAFGVVLGLGVLGRVEHSSLLKGSSRGHKSK